MPLSSSEIIIKWNDLINETTYTLFRSIVNDTNNLTNKFSFISNTVSFIDTGLDPDTKYYYWLKAFNGIKSSPYSVVMSNITSGLLPDAPIWLIADAVSSNQINLKWSNNTNEISYIIYRNTIDDTNTSINIGGTYIDITNYSDTALLIDEPHGHF